MSKKFMDYCKKWLDEHQEYNVQQKVIWIHGLFQGYEISEKNEEELYAYVDPKDTVQNPADLWWNDDSENQLEKAVMETGMVNTYTIPEMCDDIVFDDNPQSVDVYFINRDGEPDSTQFDLYEDDKVTELEDLWLDQCDEIFNANADSVTEVVLYGDIQR